MWAPASEAPCEPLFPDGEGALLPASAMLERKTEAAFTAQASSPFHVLDV